MTCPLTANQLIGVIRATTTQAQVMTYSLTGTADFIISVNGEIRTTRVLSGPTVVNFQVTATDNLGGSAVVQISVSVPGCQRPPTFSQSAYTFNVACPNSANILIGTVTTQSVQGQQGLTYNLLSTRYARYDLNSLHLYNVPRV